jgi:hypothetical protein
VTQVGKGSIGQLKQLNASSTQHNSAESSESNSSQQNIKTAKGAAPRRQMQLRRLNEAQVSEIGSMSAQRSTS